MTTGHFIRTEKHKRNIGLANKGKKHTEETKNKMRKPHVITKVYIKTAEHKKNISLALKGRKGIPCTEENKIKSRLRMMGKNNPNWGGGVTRKKEIIRGHSFYKDWRKKVFERDNYTCQICHVRGGYLEVDHIKTLYEIIKDYLSVKDLNEFKKVVWDIPIMKDINNGRTLCRNCHKKTDTWGSKYRWRLLKEIKEKSSIKTGKVSLGRDFGEVSKRGNLTNRLSPVILF